jgi:hypothetical protein
MLTNFSNFTFRLNTGAKYLDSVYKTLVTIAVGANLATAAVGSDSGNPMVILKASAYASKELKEFRKRKSLSPKTIKRILRISGFYARAAAKNEIASKVGLGVPYGYNGLPDFNGDPVHPDNGVVFIPLSGNRNTDKRLASAARRRPDDPLYVWHHHESIGIMMYVKRGNHAAAGHVGGAFFWTILNDKDKYN